MRYLRAVLIVMWMTCQWGYAAPPGDQETALDGETPAAGLESVTPVEWSELAFAIKDRTEFDPAQLPEHIRGLEGKRIRLRGYFHLGSTSLKPTEFLLVGEIKWHPTATKRGTSPDELPIDQLAGVEMVPGQTARVTLNPVAVTGRLTFKVVKWNGKAVLVFCVVADSVKEVRPRSGYGPALSHGC